MIVGTYDLDTWREGDLVFSAMEQCVGGAYVLTVDYESLQAENEQLKEKIKAEQKLTTLMNNDYTVLCSNHDKLKEELARARAALIDVWTDEHMELDDMGREHAKTFSEKRYKREIAQGTK